METGDIDQDEYGNPATNITDQYNDTYQEGEHENVNGDEEYEEGEYEEGEYENDEIITSPYDNDVTVLYKSLRYFGLPLNLIIIRPRTENDDEYTIGTNKFVFESLIDMVSRLDQEGETVSEIYDTIKQYKKNISIDDIVMSYYVILLDESKNIAGKVDIINQKYYELNNSQPNRYADDRDLYEYNQSWVINNNKLFEKNLKRLDVIEGIQETLSEMDKEDKIKFGQVSINSTSMSYSPTLEERMITPEDGLEIFNHSIVSKFIPFIRYNDEAGKSRTRVYNGTKYEGDPNYALTIIPYDKANNKNTIYLTLWLAENDTEQALKDASGESFFTAVYDLSANEMTIKVPVGADVKKGFIKEESIALTRVSDALPNIKFGKGKEVKVGGEFSIWDFEYEESSLLDNILIDPLMNVYLYVEENGKPFAFKKRFDVHYRSIFEYEGEGSQPTDKAYIENSASVSLTLNQKIAEVDTIVTVVDPTNGTTVQHELKAGTPYIHANIIQAISKNVVSDFMPIFQLLLTYYNKYRENTDDVYSNFFEDEMEKYRALINKKYKPPTGVKMVDANMKQVINKRTTPRIQKLQEIVPDLFVRGYARKCLSTLQPIIVSDEEAEEWKNNMIDLGTKQRQVLKFPYPNPNLNFVCPTDDAPYPTVKLNKDLPNKDIYPYIPCCAKTDQTNKQKYIDYLQGIAPQKKTGAKAEKKIITNKILAPNRIGQLPRAIYNILTRYSDNVTDIVRYGTIYSKNSLLHCISEAVDDEKYLRLEDDDAKEAYVSRIRAYIAKTVNPALLRQELYDYTDDEIINVLSDSTKFYDPSLVYRAIEEIYNINIYVFSPSGVDDKEMGSLHIPRFKMFHSRPLRLNRPTVVLMKTWGSESDNLEHPQCEIVVDYDDKNFQIRKLFGADMTELCHTTLQNTLKTITWTVTPDIDFVINSNIYYYIDHLNILNVPPVSQYIDNNGKMRSLTVNIGSSPGSRKLVTLATLPSQPENLQLSTSTEIFRISVEDATKIFGLPTAATRDTNGNITGLWYQIFDIKHAECVYVLPTRDNTKITLKSGEILILKDLENGPKDPLSTAGENVTSRLSRLRKCINVITQVIKWLYELSKLTRNIDPDIFINDYVVHNTYPVPDSSTYYDITNIPRRLPETTTIEEAISILEPLAPTLFSDGKIVMYSQQFGERIHKMLMDYHVLHIGLPVSPQNFIINFYETEKDFLQVPNSSIFLSEHDLSSWLFSIATYKNYIRNFSIKTKIDATLGFTPNPYLYQDEDGKIFIIQNILGGNKAKALSVATGWFNYKINLGSDPLPLTYIPSHMVYGISNYSTLVPIEDQTEGGTIFVRLLYYGTQKDKISGNDDKYAAMLELL